MSENKEFEHKNTGKKLKHEYVEKEISDIFDFKGLTNLKKDYILTLAYINEHVFNILTLKLLQYDFHFIKFESYSHNECHILTYALFQKKINKE